MYASNPSTVFDAIKSKRQFDDICSIQTVDIELKCMLKPFGRGTFRSAYYAVDNKGYKLVVKVKMEICKRVIGRRRRDNLKKTL